MASVQGQILICDRCGTHKFFESGQSFDEEFAEIYVGGGVDKLLCTKCAHVYDDMHRSFWQGSNFLLSGINKEVQK